MHKLVKDRTKLEGSSFAEEYGIESTECRTCGETAYRFDDPTTFEPPVECEECDKQALIEWIESDDYNTVSALQRLKSHGYLPFRDPRDDGLVTDVEVDHVPGTGNFVKSITKIVERECPECGHDRANYNQWKVYTCEHGEGVTCRACGHVIEQEDTL
jgi:DNA-directed RNA polymerase subunit RPC12/RpoP